MYRNASGEKWQFNPAVHNTSSRAKRLHLKEIKSSNMAIESNTPRKRSKEGTIFPYPNESTHLSKPKTSNKKQKRPH